LTATTDHLYGPYNRLQNSSVQRVSDARAPDRQPEPSVPQRARCAPSWRSTG